MSDRCLDPHDLAALAAVPRGDPRRAHVDRCPRCEAALHSYRDFVDPGELPPEANAEQASRKLEATLQREILAEDAAPQAVRGRATGHAPGGWMRRLRWPVLAPALVGAAALVLVVLTGQNESLTGGGGGLRGGQAASASETAEPISARVQALRGAELLLEWDLPAAADQSVIVFFAGDLSELDRQTVAAGQSLRLPVESERAAPLAPARYWRVIAISDGEEIARSALKELRAATP